MHRVKERARFILIVSVVLAAAMLTAANLPGLAASGGGGTTERVSVSSAGAQGNAYSFNPAISADGRYVAFYSAAANLVAGDSNGVDDVFVHDRETGATERVSVSSTGVQTDDASINPAISADGRYVAFSSNAKNLFAGFTNGYGDVYIHDRQTGVTEPVSSAIGGGQGDAGSYLDSISPDGRFVTFTSAASNLVAGDTNTEYDVYLHDRQTGVTERVSVPAAEEQAMYTCYYGPSLSISADGRFVAFRSCLDNLVENDRNTYPDIFIRDRQTQETTRISVAPNGAEADNESDLPVISASGRYVAFTSYATNLAANDTNAVSDVFIYNMETGLIELASLAPGGEQGDNSSAYSSFSADDRYLAFSSQATNMVSGDTNGKVDVFMRDLSTGVNKLVSVSSAGEPGNNYSYPPAISGDGKVVAFQSFASNLVAGDTNEAADIFVHVLPQSLFLPVVVR